ncbi:MAG: adenosine deaminase [Leptospiraceae bacterium]|nr:adenosine deaminase [Leptospiraceae bacterium]MCP5499063.1 adenosine deaminase [Leptospiraceae bacterium]
MKASIEKILDRIQSIDRDVNELNRLKSRLPLNRPYSPNVQLAFDYQINHLLSERVSLMEIVIQEPPSWIQEENKKRGKITLHTLDEIRTADLSLEKPSEKDVRSFIQSLPKTEVHLHLEACLDKKTLLQLIEENNIQTSEEELENVLHFEGLNGFINAFFFIQSIIKKEENLGYMVDSLAEYMRADNILYAEVFFAPSKFIQNGLNFQRMVEIIIERIREKKAEDGTDIKLLIDVSRSFGRENAMRNLEYVLELDYPEILGIGLGGAELKGPAKNFALIFEKARAAGLHTVAHSGEDDGPWEIWDAVKVLGAERIGHAVSAVQDPALVEYLAEKQIPVEICLTSNIFTGKYVRREQHHPVRKYYDSGLLTCINTDDPKIFNVNLSDEYLKLYQYLNFSLKEILDLIQKGVQSTFHPNKEALWKTMQSKISELKKDYKLGNF